MSKFCMVEVAQVARGQNGHADSLATFVSLMTEDVPRLIKVELITEPSINVVVSIATISTSEPYWMNPIINFLVEDRVSDDEKEANRVRRVAARYWLSADRKLYQRSFGGLYLLCLHLEKVKELLAELQGEVCGSYGGGHSLAHRAMTQGFWWPQMQKDATKYVQRCGQCQKHAPLIHQPAGHLNPVNSP